MRVVDLNLEKDDLEAVGPMPKVIARLDQYHAPPLALSAPRVAEMGPKTAPKRLRFPSAGHGSALGDLSLATRSLRLGDRRQTQSASSASVDRVRGRARRRAGRRGAQVLR
ncbi:MAG: hypothetical protein WAU78_14390, partial [Roseiarcus sp.]